MKRSSISGTQRFYNIPKYLPEKGYDRELNFILISGSLGEEPELQNVLESTSSQIIKNWSRVINMPDFVS